MPNHSLPPKVALLATGDEVINGDILNTNTQALASKLFHQGISVGNHMTARDQIDDIEQAMGYLLNDHQALITIGGLGPTSDDVTRFALANVTQRHLMHDDATWNNIVQRLKHLGYDTPPESNKQQALFPAGATIIPNPNGTAAGCMLQQDKAWIFMLPGPPAECLPMFEQAVLPMLSQQHFQRKQFHRKWLLFGVSEGEIAEKLDAIAKPYAVTTGYRIWFPYIEFKIYATDEASFKTLEPLIQAAVSRYLIEDGSLSASEYLKHKIPHLPFKISIHDQATGGLLETQLLTPQTYPYLSFHEQPESFHVQTDGLKEFWQNETAKTTLLHITINQKSFQKDIPLRGPRVKQYAVEWFCKKIIECL